MANALLAAALASRHQIRAISGQDQAQGCGPGLDTKVAIQVQRQSTTTDVISFSIREMPMPGPAGEYAQPYKVFVLQRTCALSSKDPESCYFDSRNTDLSGSPLTTSTVTLPTASIRCCVLRV